ncbi:hypothetical protein GGR58DRAFT_500282 [Xylaria digitata]|nr:hypothetical protein GGR58DRAFT_500282 [Xylaria digitata]
MDAQDDAILVGIKAGRAAISGIGQLRMEPIPDSEMENVLHLAARKSTTVTVQGIVFENDTRSGLMRSVVNALDMGIWAGIDAGVPYNNSVAVLRAALTAALTTSRLGIALLSQTPGSSWGRSKPWMAEAENKAIRAGVRAGKVEEVGDPIAAPTAIPLNQTEKEAIARRRAGDAVRTTLEYSEAEKETEAAVWAVLSAPVPAAAGCWSR